MLNKFMKVYEKNLLAVVSDPKNRYSEENPGGYCYGPEGVPSTVVAMRTAFERGSYNLDGKAIQKTCKELGIPHTRKAIDAFINGEKK